METSTTAEFTARACNTCGKPYKCETIMLGSRDLGPTVQPNCDDCEAANKRLAEARKQQEIMEAREALAAALLPPDLLGTDPNHPDFNRPLWNAVNKWRPSADSFWLALVGRAGKCKTRCLALAAKGAILRGHRVTWTTACRLYDAAHDRKSSDRNIATMAREHLSECQHAPILIIDDLGKNEWSAKFESQLFQILDHRKNFRLPLLYSSNSHPEQLSLLLSDQSREPTIGRLVDRTTIIEIS